MTAPATTLEPAPEFIEPTLDVDPPGSTLDPEPRTDDAPYGYLADGVTPRKSRAGRKPTATKPTPPPAKTKTSPAARKRSAGTPAPAPAPEPRTSSPRARRSAAVAPDDATISRYQAGIEKIIGTGQKALIGGGIAMKVRDQEKPATILLADAGALGALRGPFSRAVGELAAQNADTWPVRYLDKVLVASPYADAGMAALVCVAQMAVNHGLLPAGWVPGTKKPEVLAAQLLAEMEGSAGTPA